MFPDIKSVYSNDGLMDVQDSPVSVVTYLTKQGNHNDLWFLKDAAWYVVFAWETSNMKTVILEQDPNAVLNLIVFAPGDGANPVLKESFRVLNILTPFHPVLPVQDIFTIKSKGDEHSGQSLGRNIFF